MLCKAIEFKIIDDCTFDMQIVDNNEVNLDVTDIVNMHYADGDTYDGSYDITPLTTAQVMETKNKRMTDDVQIKAIPYFETSNDSGTTIYIADEIGE